VQIAVRNAPAIRETRARIEAAAAGIELADTSYLPRFDLLWQSLRGTRNNVSGQWFPQGVVTPISGAQVDKSDKSAWGSMVGGLITWEPFDFGFRAAQDGVARSLAAEAGVEVELAELEVSLRAAEAFLLSIATEEAAKAARANVERWVVIEQAVKALADQQLRPGADHSRAQAELALARNHLIQAEQAVETGRATLAETLGFRDLDLRPEGASFLRLPEAAGEEPETRLHPLLRRRQAAVLTADARRQAAESAFAPRVSLQVSGSDRGSGFGADGSGRDAADGLYPDHYNWAAGVTIVIPLMDYFGTRSKARQEEATMRAERARVDAAVLHLAAEERRAKAAWEASRRIAENTPLQRRAAEEAQTRSRTRYDVGLGTLSELAETQRLLAQAEIDDGLARLAVWRALVQDARAKGHLGRLLAAAARAAEGTR
jgi:outer membrane protein